MYAEAVILPLLIIFFTLPGYLLPAIVAYLRKHPRPLLILALSILFGWTIIGWLILLVWAYRAKDKAL